MHVQSRLTDFTDTEWWAFDCSEKINQLFL